MLFFPGPNNLFVFPNAASIVLRASNYRIALVVERAGEDIVFVSLQHLQLQPCVGLPYSACFVHTCGDDLVALRIELNFGDLVLMPLQ